jgi:hypothetical protein
MTTRFPVLLVVGLAALALTARPARAQSLALAPAEVIQTFTPGQPFKVEFSVSNASSQPIAVRTRKTRRRSARPGPRRTRPPTGSSSSRES